MKNSMEEKNRIKSVKQNLYKILLIVFILIIICNIYILAKWNFERKKNAGEIKEITHISNKIELENNENVELINPPDDRKDSYWDYIYLPFMNVNLEELKKINNDTVGFISVSGTDVSYPIVQTRDNNYYLNHSFKEEINKSGWIFADYRSNFESFDKNTIIYGHNMLDGTMFGTLKDILKSEWINNKENHVIRLSTLTRCTLWQIFSIYTIPVDSYYINTGFNSDQEYQYWLDTMKIQSKYNFNTNIDVNDKVLTLSTCYINSNKRLVIHAKLIKSLTLN